MLSVSASPAIFLYDSDCFEHLPKGGIIMPYAEFCLGLLFLWHGGGGGLEREVYGRPAGRTYLILSLGTALLMVLSEYLLVAYIKYPGLGLQGDPGRSPGRPLPASAFLAPGSFSVIRTLSGGCLPRLCLAGLLGGSGSGGRLLPDQYQRRPFEPSSHSLE